MGKQIKKPKHMLTGVSVGDFYTFTPETFIDEIKKYGDGKIFNYLSMKTLVPPRNNEPITKEFLFEAAEYMRDHGIHFTLRSDFRKKMSAMDPLYDKDVVKKLEEIAGDYYLGNELLEFGGFYSSKAKKYKTRIALDSEYTEEDKIPSMTTYHTMTNPVQGLKTVKEAAETYSRKLAEAVNPHREAGTSLVSALEAVTMFPYSYDAGVDFCSVEVAPRNMEQIMNFARGSQRAYKKPILGAWLAHEWYGGNINLDELKAKRMWVEYMTSYLAGIDFICLEGGYSDIHTFGDNFPEEHPVVQRNLKTAIDFAKFANEDVRPGENGPITKVAFVQGNYDGFGWGNSSSLWGQYFDESFGYGNPEFSYRVLDDVYRKSEWHNTKNYGDVDLSQAPAYGMYDVVPATAPLEVLKQYELIIFCGWNTMTKEILDTFKSYVKGGGKLLVTAAHLRDSIERDKKGEFVDKEGLEEFLGVKIKDEIMHTNDGYKFSRKSDIPCFMYPTGTLNYHCDPCWSAGYTDYVMVEPTTAQVGAYITDTFNPDFDRMWPCVTENKYGDGFVIFMTNSEYPGAPQIFPLYQMLVKGLITAGHRASDLKVVSSDKIRFAVYEDEENYKMYILNTDFDLPESCIVDYKGNKTSMTINPCDLKILEFKK